MLDKDKYKHFSRNNNNIPIFSKPWWLDAVSNKGQWDVIFYEKNNIINGSFPFFIKKKSFFKISLLPRLTQKLGPFQQKVILWIIKNEPFLLSKYQRLIILIKIVTTYLLMTYYLKKVVFM